MRGAAGSAGASGDRSCPFHCPPPPGCGLARPQPSLPGWRAWGGTVMLEGGRQRGRSGGVLQQCWPWPSAGFGELVVHSRGKPCPGHGEGHRGDAAPSRRDGWTVKSSGLRGSLSGKWRSPHWQGYLRLDFETRDTLQLGTMLHCQRDGLNYLIGPCCLSPAIFLSRTYIQLGYFSWEDKAL